MELDPETKRLTNLIIKALNAKFDFELNSDVYKVYNYKALKKSSKFFLV